MNAPLRFNLLLDVQAELDPRWTSANAMQVVAAYGNDAEAAVIAGIGDLTWLARTGCKGPGAAQWLVAQCLPIPDAPNQWLPLDGGALIARLGRSEFLIEDGDTSAFCAGIAAAAPGAGVYPVLRQDAELVLCGARIGELLLQACSFDFASLDLSSRPVVLTSMVGVGVAVLPFPSERGPAYRLWCDSTYGAWLWRTLTGIARELGGGPVGVDALR